MTKRLKGLYYNQKTGFCGNLSDNVAGPGKLRIHIERRLLSSSEGNLQDQRMIQRMTVKNREKTFFLTQYEDSAVSTPARKDKHSVPDYLQRHMLPWYLKSLVPPLHPRGGTSTLSESHVSGTGTKLLPSFLRPTTCCSLAI